MWYAGVRYLPMGPSGAANNAGSQAWADPGAQSARTSNSAGSTRSTTPVLGEGGARPAWVTRRGPIVPGVSSEKHMRCSTPPGSSTVARLRT
jgi:hypothetical protein